MIFCPYKQRCFTWIIYLKGREVFFVIQHYETLKLPLDILNTTLSIATSKLTSTNLENRVKIFKYVKPIS